jgi:hypothetical protein
MALTASTLQNSLHEKAWALLDSSAQSSAQRQGESMTIGEAISYALSTSAAATVSFGR